MRPPGRKPQGIFLNTAKAACSIYESGLMMYQSLLLSEKFELDYLELDEARRQVPNKYDFYAFNYHYLTMGWLDLASVRQLPGLKVTFVLETLRNDPFVLCPPHFFDAYCALDPTMNVGDKSVYTFPRPLEVPARVTPYSEPAVPVIGTFGFPTPGKGYDRVVEAVNREFDEAVVRINISPGTYFAFQGRTESQYLSELCRSTAKDGITVVVTHDYMTKDELIEWCSQNTLNCFLYHRNIPGLAATVDQAISSGRPLAVSANETFRHVHSYLKPYPSQSLKESIRSSVEQVRKMQEDWTPQNFAIEFETVLKDRRVFASRSRTRRPQLIELLKKQHSTENKTQVPGLTKRIAINLLPPILPKLAGIMRKGSHFNERSAAINPPTRQIPPFTHEALRSYSQHNEDLLIDLLFLSKKSGFYVDVGANDPKFNSNTKRFYDKGWSGINIEPGPEGFRRLSALRKRDINLNIGVSPQKGQMTYYLFPDDSTLSTFDESTAQKMAEAFQITASQLQIETLPLEEIFDKYLDNKQIDFMSVDAEGFDLNVLKSNQWKKYRPSALLVEINNQYEQIRDFLEEREFLLMFNNFVNGLFIDTKTSDPHLRDLLKDYS